MSVNVGIASVGLVTAQGDAREIANGTLLREPASLPWPASRWTTCTTCRPAAGVEASLAGMDRFRALAQHALAECFSAHAPPPGTPLLLASCNGSADDFDAEHWHHAFDAKPLLDATPWAHQPLPFVSASCVSGLHALFLATRLLAAGHHDVVVLAVDILSSAHHDNFEALRMLASQATPPWQPGSTGFIPGEAAVALWLTRSPTAQMPRLDGPVLSQDWGDAAGLTQVLAGFGLHRPDLVIGHGTGPPSVDAAELHALTTHIDPAVPLTTALHHFGHTNGVSGLLSVALAALAHQTATPLPALTMPLATTSDGRPLAQSVAAQDIVVVCQALGGACAAAQISLHSQPDPAIPSSWKTPSMPGPLMHPLLRRIASEAMPHRPEHPPDVLFVRLVAPLRPPSRAVIGGRLLPSAVLEITPGFVSQLIARCWGFSGAALCLVGNAETHASSAVLIQACQESDLSVSLVTVHETDDQHYVEWTP